MGGPNDGISMDFDSLNNLSNNLTSIKNEFDGAADDADATANATGDDDLADQVRDFASRWRIKRESLSKDVGSLQQAVQQIVETFQGVDTQLTSVLQGNGSAGGGGGGGGASGW